MTYYPDLSPYEFTSSAEVPAPLNVGWLDPDHSFGTAKPDEQMLDRLWQFCRISVWRRRSKDDCPLCGHWGDHEHDGTTLLLGAAEIRVFDQAARIVYAAPTMIYHYVREHHYRPPREFLEALDCGPQPGSPEYRDLLKRSGVEWKPTSPFSRPFRFVKKNGEVVREWEPRPHIK